MSWRALNWIEQQDITPSGAKFVAVMLANYADEEYVCYPSQATLARATAQSERTVRAHLAALEAEGWIERVPRRGEDGVFRSDVYRLRVPPEWDRKPAGGRARKAKAAESQASSSETAPAANSAAGPPADFAAGPAASFDRTSGNFPQHQRQVLQDSIEESGIESVKESGTRAHARANGPNDSVCGEEPDRPRPGSTVVEPGVPPGEAERWHQARNALRQRLGGAVFAAWIAPLRLVGAGGGVWSIAARSKFVADTVRSSYERELQRALGGSIAIIVRSDTHGRGNDPASG